MILSKLKSGTSLTRLRSLPISRRPVTLRRSRLTISVSGQDDTGCILAFGTLFAHIPFFFSILATSPTKVKSVELAPHAGFSLDASTIDVYRNTDGVILVYNSSKPWTFDYAVKALSEIPVSMPVLILVCYGVGGRESMDRDFFFFFFA